MGLRVHLGRLGRALGAGLVFVLAAGGGALAHRNVPAASRAILARVNAALVKAVPGRIVIEQVGTLGLGYVTGAEVAIADPDGAPVLQVHGLAACIDLVAMAESLRTGGPLAIELSGVSASSVDVSLDPAPGGALRLVRAFVATGPASPAGRGVHLLVPEARLGRVTVHGAPIATLPLDVDVEGLTAGVEVAPGSLGLDVSHADVTARDLSLGPTRTTVHGSLEGHLEQPSGHGGARAARVHWSGTVGAIAATASAMLDGDAVYAVVDAPSVRPADLAALWPASPIVEPVAAHVEAVGVLPTLLVSVRATCGPGAIEAHGPVVLDGTRRAAMRVALSSFDAHAVSEHAPQTRLDASGDVLVGMTPAGAMGGVAALNVAGAVGATLVPQTALTADFARDAPPSSQVRAKAHLVVREPGAPSTIDATIAPRGDAFEVVFDASVVVPDLDHVLRLGPIAQGSARITAHGRYDTGTEHVDASVSARASHVSAGPVSLGSLSIDARASGPLATPDLDGDIHGQDLDIAGLTVAHLRAGIHGPASGAEVSLGLGGANAHLQATATVAMLGASATVRDLNVRAERGDARARMEATRITVTAKEQSIEEAEIHGFGAPLHFTAQATPGAVSFRTHSHAIDLARIGRFAGLANALSGHVSLDVDATLHKTEGEGHIVLEVTGATLGPLGSSEAHADVSLSGRRLAGVVSARVGDVGTLSLQSSSLEIGGTAPLGATSWRTIWGLVDVQGHVDLAKLASRLPGLPLPFSRIGGVIDVLGHVGRDSDTDSSPEVDLAVSTAGLTASGPPSAPWTLKGIDLQADLTIDGRTARTMLQARATDAHGVLTSGTFASDHIPYLQLLSGEAPPAQLLRTTPFAGTLLVPPRSLADFPAFLGTRGIQGDLVATLAWSGTLESPSLDLNAKLSRARTDVRVLALPFDLEVTGHYDGAHLGTRVVASARSTRMLDAFAEVDAQAADVLARLTDAGAPLPWKASAQVQLTRFPLQTIAVLDDQQMRGHLSGELVVAGLHDDAHATVSLSSDDLIIGELPCKLATAKASLDGDALDAQVRLDEADGTMQVTAHTGARWGAALVPSLDEARPADLALSAKTFRVQLLQPLVESVFAELDGRVDADVRVHADPSKHLLQPQGSIRLVDGVVEVAGFGGEFHAATAELDLTPDGVLRLQKASAMGLSGKLEAAASARFDGFAFAGARASLQVLHKQPLPLVLDGVQVGTFDGQVGVAVDPVSASQGGGYDVKLDVPQMLLQLPQQTARKVQSLGALDDVTVGMQLPGRPFVARSLDGPTQTTSGAGRARSPVHLTVTLGNDVSVKRGTSLQVYLDGSPSLLVTDDVQASGQVRLLRGTLEVQGKAFTIETGSVTFLGDPTNPQVVLTASWPAPDGTTIYADFVGPLKTGKVTLRSDPARPQNEILSLILFGTTDEQTASAGGATAQQSGAVGAAGGAATAPINQALGGVNQMLDSFGLVGGISTRIDTSQATPRPEVEIQIARDLSIQVAWVLGVPPPGSNPDSTLFTLDWRFLRSWSLETTVGDAGTSILDLIWRHRY